MKVTGSRKIYIGEAPGNSLFRYGNKMESPTPRTVTPSDPPTATEVNRGRYRVPLQDTTSTVE